MPHAEHETTVGRPAEDVFAFVSNPENDSRWRDGVLELERLSGDGGVGSRYRQVVKGPGGRRVDADIEVTEHEPPRSHAFRTTSGPVRPSGRYTLERAGDATRLRFELDAELGGLKRLLSPMVARTMSSEVAAIEKLRQLLES
jgi:carbon monoxide dehydrogenase subunit G